jgi:hypothetical protein
MSERFHGSVRPVRDRERIVDVNIAQALKSGGERGIVFFLALVEASVFQAENIAGL